MNAYERFSDQKDVRQQALWAMAGLSKIDHCKERMEEPQEFFEYMLEEHEELVRQAWLRERSKVRVVEAPPGATKEQQSWLKNIQIRGEMRIQGKRSHGKVMGNSLKIHGTTHGPFMEKIIDNSWKK